MNTEAFGLPHICLSCGLEVKPGTPAVVAHVEALNADLPTRNVHFHAACATDLNATRILLHEELREEVETWLVIKATPDREKRAAVAAYN